MGSGSSESDDESPERIFHEVEVASMGVCPHCGSKLILFKEHGELGWRCVKCGWVCYMSEDFDSMFKASGSELDVDFARVRRKFDKAMSFLNRECPVVGEAYAVSKLLTLFFEERFGCELSPVLLAEVKSLLDGVEGGPRKHG